MGALFNFYLFSQVVSEPEIVEKAADLDAILEATLSNDPSSLERLAE